jgi:hypothetical protein
VELGRVNRDLRFWYRITSDVPQSIQRLGHGVHLVVVPAVRKCSHLLEELWDPGCGCRMRQVDVTGLDLRRYSMRARNLSPSGFTAISPSMSCCNSWMTAGPLALSSISLVAALGHF